MSGALHVSTMDGWWREAFNGENGWQIGDDAAAPTEYEQDEKDAASLRLLIENEAIPLFYDRGKSGLPHAWLKRVRHSLATLIPVYNTHRMVAEYTRLYYCPEAGTKEVVILEAGTLKKAAGAARVSRPGKAAGSRKATGAKKVAGAKKGTKRKKSAPRRKK